MSIIVMLPEPFLLATPLIRLGDETSDEVQASFREHESGVGVLLRQFLANLVHLKGRNGSRELDVSNT
jgi:hypothetical protein